MTGSLSKLSVLIILKAMATLSIQQIPSSEINVPLSNDLPQEPRQGLLYVDAYFTNPSLSINAYDKWYNESHIPHLLTMTGCHAAMRYVDVDPSAKIPFLTLYPLKDVSWVHSAEFGTAIESTFSDEFPGKSVFLSVAFDGRSYTLKEEVHGETPGPTTHIVLTALRPSDSKSAPFPLWKTGPAFNHMYRYSMHAGQPEEWLERWRGSDMPGGMPERELVIQEFGSGTGVGALIKWAQEIEKEETERVVWDTVSSRVYQLTDSFGEV
jgi:hypothetical protein